MLCFWLERSLPYVSQEGPFLGGPPSHRSLRVLFISQWGARAGLQEGDLCLLGTHSSCPHSVDQSFSLRCSDQLCTPEPAMAQPPNLSPSGALSHTSTGLSYPIPTGGKCAARTKEEHLILHTSLLSEPPQSRIIKSFYRISRTHRLAFLP